MGAKPYMKGDYGNKPAGGVEENKANQSQLELVKAGFKTPPTPGERGNYAAGRSSNAT
jgi:hypothetical protein